MKRTLPELKPALTQTPGYGLLTLQGWETPEASFDFSYEVCVQRNQDSRFLGADNQWTATQTWHQVDTSESQNEFVALTLGPNIVDPLVENPQMTYQLQARYGAELAQGVIRIGKGVLSSHASGQTGEAVSRIAKPVQAVSPTVAPEPLPVAEQETVADPVTQPKSKSSQTLLVVAIVLVLLLIAAYFGWRWYQGQQSAPVATSAPSPTVTAGTVTTPPTVTTVTPAPGASVAPTPAAPSAAPACSSEALAATKDDLSFIQSCLKSNPDTAKVLAMIELAKTAKRCDVAQRMYAFKGQGGDVVIALAYAKEFDPKFFVAGCLTAADKNTALYWYDLVLAKDPNHTEAKERAEALRK
jgi:hypothetical protein